MRHSDSDEDDDDGHVYVDDYGDGYGYECYCKECVAALQLFLMTVIVMSRRVHRRPVPNAIVLGLVAAWSLFCAVAVTHV